VCSFICIYRLIGGGGCEKTDEDAEGPGNSDESGLWGMQRSSDIFVTSSSYKFYFIIQSFFKKIILNFVFNFL
jgi:hypothetical protein